MTVPSSAGFVTRARKGPFIRPFTKTPPGKVCPPVYVLSHANGCSYRCDYCYLQLTFRHLAAPTVFSNQQDLMREVRQFLGLPRPSVLHAGKLCDSLLYDSETNLSKQLVPLFAAQDKHKLLLLTKSITIGNLLQISDHRNTVVSFSLNAPEIARRFERSAPTPEDRIAAAKKCQDAGYEVRVRIDPVIPIAGWRELYAPLVRAIVEGLNTKGLRVTIGNLRYFKSLPLYAKSRGADTSVFDVATRFDPTDGRMRVLPAVRLEMYQWFRAELPVEAEVLPCKEPPQTWRTLGLDPAVPRCNCAL